MKRKNKEIKLSAPHPENAKQFLEWLQAKLMSMPYEMRPFATIKLNASEIYDDIGVIVDFSLNLKSQYCIDGIELVDGFKCKMDLGDGNTDNGIYSVVASDWVIKS